MGPDALRCAGLVPKLREAGCDAADCGDLRIPSTDPSFDEFQEKEDASNGSGKVKYLREVVRLNKRLCRVVAASHANQRLPLVIGGDHSIAMGSLAASAMHTNGKIGVIWFDAHGDLNTFKTTPTGNIHGMSLAASLGFGSSTLTRLGGIRPKVSPQQVVLIGTRSLDPGEQELIQQTGIRVFSIREIDRIGMEEVMRQALAVVTKETEGIHLSFDLDGLDPAEAPGVGTPVAHGIRTDESLMAMKAIRDTGMLLSADFVELNPALDLRNRTAKAGVQMMCSLLCGCS